MIISPKELKQNFKLYQIIIKFPTQAGETVNFDEVDTNNVL